MTISKREFKSLQIIRNNDVEVVNQSKFLVRSQSNPNRQYEVAWQKNRWCCNCDDYAKRGTKCKHIYAVHYHQMLKAVILGAQNNKKNNTCPNCDSYDFVEKYGFDYERSGPVQKYHCKRCNRWFRDRKGFENMKNQATVIVAALDLYYRGLSLRQIVQHLESLYGVKVSYGAVYYWLKKYVQLIHNYMHSNLRVRTSERWHADDTIVKVQGRDLVIWGLLDSQTRFLIALHLSQRKTAEEASRLIRKGLSISKDPPLEIITDGLPSYGKAIENEFSTRNANSKIIHLQGPLTAPLNNNKMERFYCTLKGRIRNMGHLNNIPGSEIFVKGFPIYYDFIRKHQALNDKTPAEVAGVTQERLTWMQLINESSSKKQHNQRD